MMLLACLSIVIDDPTGAIIAGPSDVMIIYRPF